MKHLYSLGIILLITLHTYAQDSLTVDIDEKARLFYAELSKEWGTVSGEFSANYYKEHGLPPFGEAGGNFYKDFHRKKRDTLSALIYEKSNCFEDAIGFIDERLQIWERGSNNVPDSTIILLLDHYYRLDKDSAIEYCINHWREWRPVYGDIQMEREVFPVENYSYVSFLFDNLSQTELINALLKVDEVRDGGRNRLIDMCLREIKRRTTKVDRENIVKFVNARIEVDGLEEFNEYFLKQINKTFTY